LVLDQSFDLTPNFGLLLSLQNFYAN